MLPNIHANDETLNTFSSDKLNFFEIGNLKISYL